MRKRLFLRLLLAAAVVLPVALTAGRWFPALMDAVTRLGEAGPAGDAIFAGIYAAGSWLMLPASWLQGASGFLYGPLLGVAVSWALSTLFGAVSYELARGWLRGLVAPRLESMGYLGALDRALARRGLIAVILLRLSPFAPYNVISYALGATAVPRGTFWLGTALGSLVPATAWTLVGTSIGDLAALTSGEASFGGARWVVIAATLVATAGIGLFVRRALSDDPGPAAALAR